MDKKWYLILRGEKMGPFSVNDMKFLADVTPDTLAWKEGMPDWLPLRQIPELEVLFKDPQDPFEVEEEGEETIVLPRDTVIPIPNAQPPMLFWWIFSILLVLYAIFQLYFN